MSYLNYQYIKAYYTGGGNGSNLGTITFNVPDDAKELPFKAINADVSGVVNASCFFDSNDKYNGTIAVPEAKAGILTKASNPAGYFYFIKMGEIFIADRIVALGTSYDELYEAGYIDGKFRVLSKEEYETTLSSNEEKGNIDKWHKKFIDGCLKKIKHEEYEIEFDNSEIRHYTEYDKLTCTDGQEHTVKEIVEKNLEIDETKIV